MGEIIRPGRPVMTIKLEFSDKGECVAEGRKVVNSKPVGGGRSGQLLDQWGQMAFGEVLYVCSAFVTSSLQANSNVRAQASRATDLPDNEGEGEDNGKPS